MAARNHGVRSYAIGWLCALCLTVAAFAVVQSHRLTLNHTLGVVAALGCVQVLVHLRFFLHVRLKHSSREEVAALLFTAILLLLMVGGSLWIMFDLHFRMMPDHACLARPANARSAAPWPHADGSTGQCS